MKFEIIQTKFMTYLVPSVPAEIIMKYVFLFMGIKEFPKRFGEYLFEIVMRRYETKSTIMKTLKFRKKTESSYVFDRLGFYLKI